MHFFIIVLNKYTFHTLAWIGYSYEMQLIVTLQYLQYRDECNIKIKRVDMAILVICDTVPHNKLLYNLKHYGINGNTPKWLSIFLKLRSQKVVLDGTHSLWTHVDSGVPQGTLLGPLLFIPHINDLPNTVSLHVSLFADDRLIYKAIKSVQDQDSRLKTQKYLLTIIYIFSNCI